jgi:protein-L-isoaspartate(D-aspartate) O-methyltransferase
MSEYAAQRLNMVEGQVRANDVTDKRIQDAMASLPRERFVPAHLRPVAYMDNCLELTRGRYLMDARCFAKLAHLAAIESDDHVLEVGCTSGYSTAVLAHLAKHVVALEEDAELLRHAGECLKGTPNVELVQGRLTDGFSQRAPYDVIFVNGALDARPDHLLRQLKNGGRLVAVIREGGRGQAHLFVNSGGAFSERIVFDAQIPVLPGFERVPGFVF